MRSRASPGKAEFLMSVADEWWTGDPAQTVGRLPVISEIRKSTRKAKNRTLAIHAAVPAMTKNPSTPAIRETMRKMMAYVSIRK
jgi:hypothetical protein